MSLQEPSEDRQRKAVWAMELSCGMLTKELGHHPVGAGSHQGLWNGIVPPSLGTAWVLEPHLYISVGNVLAVQKLDSSANISHYLCSLCRHRELGGQQCQSKVRSPGGPHPIIHPGHGVVGQHRMVTFILNPNPRNPSFLQGCSQSTWASFPRPWLPLPSSTASQYQEV